MPKMDKWKEKWYRQVLLELCRELEEQDAPSKVAVIFRALGEPVSPACKELAAGILAEYLRFAAAVCLCCPTPENGRRWNTSCPP